MKKLIVTILFAATVIAVGATDIIAHRGYWKHSASAQNSRSSLQTALTLPGVWGTEMDLWLTADDTLVVHHDDKIDGVVIENARFSDIADKRLANGETLPTFSEILEIARANRGNAVKLIVEIKTHSTPERTIAAAEATHRAITAAGLDSITEYIAFDYGACRYLAGKGFEVAYLNGDKTPDECHADRIAGIDYHQNDIDEALIKRAHELGMTVNVWTVNAPEQIKMWIDRGVDRITTDNPVEGVSIAGAQ